MELLVSFEDPSLDDMRRSGHVFGPSTQGCVSLSNNRPWMDQSITGDDDEHSPRPSHYSGKACLWYLGLRSAWLPSCPLTHSQNPSRRMSPNPDRLNHIIRAIFDAAKPGDHRLLSTNKGANEVWGLKQSPSRLCPVATCGRRRASTPRHDSRPGQVVVRGYSKLDDSKSCQPATSFRSIPSRVADDKTQHSPMGSFDLDKGEIALSKCYIATKHNLRLNSHGLPTISIEGFWRV